ncbi:MAG: hypothetical protein ACHQE6_05150 [Solirubrobacterales bacterium]
MSGREPAEIAGCEHERGCITCGDTAVRMRVASVDEARKVARCVEEEDLEGFGRGAPEGELVDLGVVESVRVGDVVLVHAGTALHLERAA